MVCSRQLPCIQLRATEILHRRHDERGPRRMTRRQPKLPLFLRIVAASTVVFCLAGVSACSLESLFCGDDCEGQATVEHSAQEHSHDAQPAYACVHHSQGAEAEPHHSHDSESHSHSSHKQNDKKGSCCSTLKAMPLTAKSGVVFKPSFQRVAFLCVLLDARVSALNARENASDRPPLSRERALTHEVCTSPANRSHAPPTSV